MTYNKVRENTKRCPRCGLVKVLDEYYTKPNGKPVSYCKRCNIERTAKSSAHRKEYKKAYYLKNREKWLKYSKDYYYKNHLRSLERRRAYKLGIKLRGVV
jgi:hypothetical protein